MYLVCQRGSHGEAWPTRNHDRTGREVKEGGGRVTGALILMPSAYFDLRTSSLILCSLAELRRSNADYPCDLHCTVSLNFTLGVNAKRG